MCPARMPGRAGGRSGDRDCGSRAAGTRRVQGVRVTLWFVNVSLQSLVNFAKPFVCKLSPQSSPDYCIQKLIAPALLGAIFLDATNKF